MKRVYMTDEVKVNQVVEVELGINLEAGEYNVEVKAIDEYGIESEPVRLKVTVKKCTESGSVSSR